MALCGKSTWFNTLRQRQNGCHISDGIFKRISLNENVWNSIEISLKFVSKGPINNIPALVQIMAWRRPRDKPLSGTMMVSLLMHISSLSFNELRGFHVNSLWPGDAIYSVFKMRVLFCWTFNSAYLANVGGTMEILLDPNVLLLWWSWSFPEILPDIQTSLNGNFYGPASFFYGFSPWSSIYFEDYIAMDQHWFR